MCWKDNSAHDDVGVPIDVFREGVKDDVGALEERGRVEGR